MKKKGFTLIELLAVIVILAIILSVTSIIINIIEKSRYESAKISVLNYIDAIEFKVAQKKLYEGNTYKGLYSVKEKEITDNVETINVDIKGNLPKEGSSVTINNNGKVNDGVFYIDKYKIAYNGETKELTDEKTTNDETPKSIEEQLKELTSEVEVLKKNSLKLDDIYPVGSIYISTTDDTIEKVQERFGGKWERYAEGTSLVSAGTYTDSNGSVTTYKAGETGGSNEVTLTTSNLPAHTHTVKAEGTVSSSFTGTIVNTGSTGDGYSIGYGYSYRNTLSAGAHTHGGTYLKYLGSEFSIYTPGGAFNGVQWGTIDTAGEHTHTYPDYYATSIAGVQAHTHTVTAAGTVSSTFNGTSVNTSKVGSSSSFSVQNSYTAVYMYKRKS